MSDTESSNAIESLGREIEMLKKLVEMNSEIRYYKQQRDDAVEHLKAALPHLPTGSQVYNSTVNLIRRIEYPLL
jgi:thiamine phosphate synthase YjbQ (UPF0047 family)